MRILVTGAGGLLGAHLVAALAPTHDVVGTDRHGWWGDGHVAFARGELGDQAFVEELLTEHRPEVLIHCAGLVNVDQCEREPALAYEVNAGITGRLARRLEPNGLVLYVTTDGIFKGDIPFAREDWLPCPRTVYGRSKLHGEWEVQIARESYLIVRTNFYGWSSGRKQTSAEWLCGALQRGEPITLFDDFYFTPIYVADLVERILLLVKSGARGIVNVAGRDRISKHEFGYLIAHAAGFRMDRVTRGSIEHSDLAASRPRDMSLDTAKCRAWIGMDPPACVDGVHRFIADRHKPLSQRLHTVPTAGR